MDSIASGLGTNVNHRVADTPGHAGEDALSFGDTQSKSIYQDIGVVAFVEINFATHGRNTDSVSIAADTRDHSR